MKIDTKELTRMIPVSNHTLNRLVKLEGTAFPKPEKIGRTYYHDEPAVYDWLNTRVVDAAIASDSGEFKVRNGDKLLDTKAVSTLLGRSTTWVWANITKDKIFTKVDLSPTGNSGNPRRYFIEREIKEAFPQLIEINKK